MTAQLSQWFQDQQQRFSGQLFFDEPLSKYTYYRIGGPARVLAIPKAREDLSWIAEGIRETGIPYFILGAGSNLLVSDAGFDGLVVRASRIHLGITSEENRIRTGGSVAISTLLRRAAQAGWAGLEFLTGIPGSVGGAVFMNAGTHLGETQGALRKVEVIPIEGRDAGQSRRFSGDELKYQYRKNLYLPQGSVVWEAEWEVRHEEPAKVKATIDETLARRKATQPIDYPSCGSVFKNPKAQGVSAWQVLDQLGLRGQRIGDAQISEKHSNFIINLDKARAADVRGLIELAKSKALAKFGISLEEEVKYLGDFGSITPDYKE